MLLGPRSYLKTALPAVRRYVSSGSTAPNRPPSVLQAALYEQESLSQRAAGMKLIRDLKIQKGSSVLDLGCATGSLSKVLSEKVGPTGQVVAVDPDEDRLKIAREKYISRNIEYIQGDDKSFPPGQYDLVFCNVTIHWIHDKEGLFARVYENLRAGGRFAFTTPDGHPPIPAVGKKLFDELLGPEFLQKMNNDVKRYYTAAQYRELALDKGFKEVSISREDIYLKWKNLDHYISSMQGWFGGTFDPSEFDPTTLQKVKDAYGDGPVTQTEPIPKLQVILQKDSQFPTNVK